MLTYGRSPGPLKQHELGRASSVGTVDFDRGLDSNRAKNIGKHRSAKHKGGEKIVVRGRIPRAEEEESNESYDFLDS